MADARDFDGLITLCLDRLLRARDHITRSRWTKDYAIAEAMRGDYRSAMGLLAAGYSDALLLTGKARGRYEDEFGLVLVEFGRPAMGLDHLKLAYECHRSEGYLWGCAAAEHNTGRAYAAQGEHGKATAYFKRALDYARAINDYRLEKEICESIVEFETVTKLTEGAR